MKSIWRVTTRIYVLADGPDGDQYEHQLGFREKLWPNEKSARSYARSQKLAITRLDMNEYIQVSVIQEKLSR